MYFVSTVGGFSVNLFLISSVVISCQLIILERWRINYDA